MFSFVAVVVLTSECGDGDTVEFVWLSLRSVDTGDEWRVNEIVLRRVVSLSVVSSESVVVASVSVVVVVASVVAFVVAFVVVVIVVVVVVMMCVAGLGIAVVVVENGGI